MLLLPTIILIISVLFVIGVIGVIGTVIILKNLPPDKFNIKYNNNVNNVNNVNLE